MYQQTERGRSMKNIVVIGAGLAGLGAAWKCTQENKAVGADVNCTIIEREIRPGGLCRTEKQGDFLFDYTGHLLHFQSDLFRKLVFSLNTELVQKSRNAWIYSNQVYTRYPFQANLYGLPSNIVIDCLYEYSKQYFSHNKGEIATFEDWIKAYFGDGIARHFMIPYNSKIYKRHPRDMTPDATGRFVPSSNLKLLLAGALSENSGELGYNSIFHYPVRGGIETIIKKIVSGLDNINLGETVAVVVPSEKIVITSSGRHIPYDYLISTQPLPLLVKSIENDDAEGVKSAAEKLRHVSVLNVNFGFTANIEKMHWIYTPEGGVPFHRIGFPHNFSSSMAPSGHSSVYLEISYDPKEGIDLERARSESKKALVNMGIIKYVGDIVCEKTIDIPYGYVIFDKSRNNSLDTIKKYLESRNIYSVGRFGSWEYSSMEDAFLMGVEASSAIFKKISGSRKWGGESVCDSLHKE